MTEMQGARQHSAGLDSPFCHVVSGQRYFCFMAATAPEAFDQFSARLTLTAKQRAALRARRDQIAEYVAERWHVERVMFGGSHARGTKIRRVFTHQGDVDVYVILDNDERRYGSIFHSDPPGKLLFDMRKTLARSLPQTKIRADAPAIQIGYSDMRVDVVPAFRQAAFFGPGDGLDIPWGREWRRASPLGQQRVFKELDDAQAGRLKPLVRMVKHWRGVHPTVRLRSYHLEVLAYEIFRTIRIEDYRECVAYFFEEAARRVNYHVDDPGGSGSRVSDYLTSAIVRNASGMLARSAKLAQRAIEQPTWRSEIRRWRSPLLFGERFPAWTP